MRDMALLHLFLRQAPGDASLWGAHRDVRLPVRGGRRRFQGHCPDLHPRMCNGRRLDGLALWWTQEEGQSVSAGMEVAPLTERALGVQVG